MYLVELWCMGLPGKAKWEVDMWSFLISRSEGDPFPSAFTIGFDALVTPTFPFGFNREIAGDYVEK